MSDARLKTKIRQLVRDQLAARGFVLDKARMPQRHFPGLRQALEFQPGSGHLDGKYTINVCWTFTLASPDSESLHSCRRIGALAGHSDSWFSREPAALEHDFSRVTALLTDVALPYLERYNSVQAILSAYQEDLLSAQEAFGADPGWRQFHLGFCHAFCGDTAAAIKSLRSVVNDHSAHPYAWVKQRKLLAEQEIARLES